MSSETLETSTAVEFLRKVSLFADFPEEDLSRLCKMMQVVHLKTDEDLFYEGSRGDKVYIILSGSLDIIKSSGNRSILLATRGTGHVIGEMALLDDAPRNATVRARTDTVLYEIEQAQFEVPPGYQSYCFAGFTEHSPHSLACNVVCPSAK